MAAKLTQILCITSLFIEFFANTATDSAETPHIEKGAVSYYSSEGTALAKKLRIPPPPIRMLPIERVDPTRIVVVKNWNSAFCLARDDGCTKCERGQLDDSPVVVKFICAKT